MVDKPGNGENAGKTPAGELEVVLREYLKPTLEVYDFNFAVRPRIEEQTGEVIGIELDLSHPSWPAAVRMLWGRLAAVELATGILAVIDSNDAEKTGGGD